MNNKNYIAEFMKDNDLKIGEEFGIDGINEFYHFGSDYRLYSSLELEVPNKFQCILSGKLKIKKPPKQEYVEVDNSIPRFTEIEVTCDNKEEWVKAKFLYKQEAEIFPYYAIIADGVSEFVDCFCQARMLKPAEPMFKKGDIIEVSNDGEHWNERVFMIIHNNLYFCITVHTQELYGWKYARKVGGK